MSSFLFNPSTSAELDPLFFGFLFLVCMPSLRIANGLFTPCSLKYSPQALHTGSPSLLRRHNVVVLVPQLVQHKPKRRVAVCNRNVEKKKIGEFFSMPTIYLGFFVFYFLQRFLLGSTKISNVRWSRHLFIFC
jgi:hypothetical protein